MKVSDDPVRQLQHEIGQPLMAIGFDLLSLDILSNHNDVPEHVRKTLQELVVSLRLNTIRVGQILTAAGG